MPEKFVYRGASKDEVHKRATQTGSMFDKIIKPEFTVFSPKKGANRIRFLPSTMKDSGYYAYDIFLHRNCGPDNQSYVCLDKMLDKDCAACEERLNFLDDEDKEAADAIRVQPQRIAWVIDRNAEDDGPKIWSFGIKMEKAIASLCEDENGAILSIDHPYEGYDVEFQKEGEGIRSTYFGQKIFRNPSYLGKNERLQEKWLDFIEKHPLDTVLQFFDYDHIKKVFSGRAVTPPEDEPQERVGRRSSVRDAEPEPEEEPEEEPRATRGRQTETGRAIDDEIPEHGARGNGHDRDEPPFDGGRRVRPSREETPHDPETGEVIEERSTRRRPSAESSEGRRREEPSSRDPDRSEAQNAASDRLARRRPRLD